MKNKTTTISVSSETKKKLSLIKIQRNFKTFDELLLYLVKVNKY